MHKDILLRSYYVIESVHQAVKWFKLNNRKRKVKEVVSDLDRTVFDITEDCLSEIAGSTSMGIQFFVK